MVMKSTEKKAIPFYCLSLHLTYLKKKKKTRNKKTLNQKKPQN